MQSIGYLMQLTAMLAICITSVLSLEMDVVSVVSPTDSDGIISSYLRATRHNRTLYVIKGNLTCRPPLTEQQNEYKIRTDIYFSSSGNSQYTLTAYRLPERFFCEFLNTDYRKFIMPALVGTSTAPVTDDEQEDFCENLFKSTSEERFYEIYKAFFDKSTIPEDLHLGYYKFVIKIVHGPQKDVKSQFEIVGRLYE